MPFLLVDDPRDVRAFVYVMDSDRATKIGITTRSPEDRARDMLLGAAATVRVVRSWECASREQAASIEWIAHALLAEDRLDGEWFSTHPLVACDAVDRAIVLGPGRGLLLLDYLNRGVAPEIAMRLANVSAEMFGKITKAAA